MKEFTDKEMTFLYGMAAGIVLAMAIVVLPIMVM